MSDLFTATTAAQVEEALAKGEDIEQLEQVLFDGEGKLIKEEEMDDETKMMTAEEFTMKPLTSACYRGELEVVDCLLNHGADPNLYPEEFWVPLHWASHSGHAAIVERLIKAGANINSNQGGEENDTPLIIASREGHVDVVDCLLSHGADIEATASKSLTALMKSSRSGMIDVVDRLLAAGAKVNALTDRGTTALILACAGGHVPIIDRLVVHGSDFHHRTELSGKNALIVASECGRVKAVDRLLSLGCDPNVQDFEGWTALMWACFHRETDVARLLLDHGADPLICNVDGKRAIDLVPASSPEIQTLLNGLILLSFHHRHHHVP